MRILLRLLASAVIVGAAFFAVTRVTVPAYKCNGIRQRVAVRTELLPTLARFHKLDVTRENLTELRPCAESMARSIEDYMLLAENEKARDQNDRAIALYTEAIRLEPRPEIYFALAEAQLNAHQPEAALQNLRKSSYAAAYVHRFPDVTMRDAVLTEKLHREQRLRARAALQK
ncbi:MAG TPA: tetratricopeptide repeat protein [Thermoanaerobaculia bacterium]|jgi:cytochrome c-type biogenesis protein CcmH/NrfG